MVLAAIGVRRGHLEGDAPLSGADGALLVVGPGRDLGVVQLLRPAAQQVLDGVAHELSRYAIDEKEPAVQVTQR